MCFRFFVDENGKTDVPIWIRVVIVGLFFCIIIGAGIFLFPGCGKSDPVTSEETRPGDIEVAICVHKSTTNWEFPSALSGWIVLYNAHGDVFMNANVVLEEFSMDTCALIPPDWFLKDNHVSETSDYTIEFLVSPPAEREKVSGNEITVVRMTPHIKGGQSVFVTPVGIVGEEPVVFTVQPVKAGVIAAFPRPADEPSLLTKMSNFF
ncbi:MAG: hypothetical protein UX57_C0007G0036 [Candidatus Uhrbacteria bacterium GW2011_GWE2_46_68]|nr:MAG: hypothetical protein UX57_C0007G0036 [Candidatus Uhrbacteria bacterium GW2011_GWE2_46_68]